MSKNIKLSDEESKIILRALLRAKDYTKSQASYMDSLYEEKELLQESEIYNNMFNALFLRTYNRSKGTVKEVIRKLPSIKKIIISDDLGKNLFCGTYEKWLETCIDNRPFAEMEVIECWDHNCAAFLIVKE